MRWENFRKQSNPKWFKGDNILACDGGVEDIWVYVYLVDWLGQFFMFRNALVILERIHDSILTLSSLFSFDLLISLYLISFSGMTCLA